MKSILTKLEFHYTYLILALSMVITGYYINLIAFTSLIIIHELGHLITCKIMNIKISKITIYPYGGMIKTDDKINLNINEELSVAISGVIFQSIYFLIITYFYNIGIIREYTYDLFKMYHYSMLFVNLLPIYPLDGSKIINLILSKIFPFYLSNILTIIISFITIILWICLKFPYINYSYIMIISVIIYNLYQYIKGLKYVFHRFVLERYLYDFPYVKKKKITKIKNMYKNKKHIFLVKDRKIEEKEYLKEFIYSNNKRIE